MMRDYPDTPIADFSQMTPALWESMVPQPRQDAYTVAKFHACAWLRYMRRLPGYCQRSAPGNRS